ncbi:hypothetical protein EDEG_02725 [Edhazardia aedis USNM 41457]|uniref:CSD domain-containing protein n=1 Tax=Edhazardia aedis (strain USNM 41457) TaxID=1003232 RepID=J9D510_EDHAE|nr:hypothetical protein EDEG_02725 [Edhazardia aedis USNM 41457]|eukprot:EJW02901.1 hypothetical protein EDEG_02725 [Edhazardia aedis USNM 41457]
MEIERNKYKGTIKFFSYRRGYGFIIPDDRRITEDVFFHFSAISDVPGMVVYLIPDEKVEFDLLKGPRGYLAKNLTSNHKVTSDDVPNNNNNISCANKKVGTIYHHYYCSFKKIMNNLIEDQIKKIQNHENKE